MDKRAQQSLFSRQVEQLQARELNHLAEIRSLEEENSRLRRQ
jgi:hypothetical protein